MRATTQAFRSQNVPTCSGRITNRGDLSRARRHHRRNLEPLVGPSPPENHLAGAEQDTAEESFQKDANISLAEDEAVFPETLGRVTPSDREFP